MWREGDVRQEGELGHRELGLQHLHVERGIEQVGVLVESLLDEGLQLRVGEDGAPRQIAKRRGVGDGKGVGERHGVADEPLGVDLRALVLIVESAAGEADACGGEQ